MNDFKGMSRPLQTIQTKTGLADKIIYHLENDQDEFSAKSNILYRNIINKVLEYIKK